MATVSDEKMVNDYNNQEETNNMNTNKQHYLTSDQIYEQWLNWKQTGEITDEMGKMMLTLAQKVMTMKYFNRYPQYMKDDMIQDGVMKIITNLKNMKAEKRTGFFSYWTHCVFTAGIVYLAKHYKYLNNKRQMILDAIERAECDGDLELPRYLKELAEELQIRQDEYEQE